MDGCVACQIVEGFECDGANPSTCSDVDECADSLDDCDPNATCNNSPGGYTCDCKDGYEGNGTVCSDVDECLTGTDECNVRATCTNSTGAYSCTCRSGYFGDGFTCVQPPSCEGLAANCGANDNESCCASPEVTGEEFELGNPADGVTSEARISTFRLDKYEVTVGRFARFWSDYEGPPQPGAGAHPVAPDTGWCSEWDDAIAASASELLFDEAPECTDSARTVSRGDSRLPMNCVTWYEAFAFCAWDGGRLPTEAEWELAASGGSEARLYPWGDTDPTSSLAVFNCIADGSAAGQCANADLPRVGSRPSGAGKFSQLDLAGSLTEWGLDSYRTYESTCEDCAFVDVPDGAQGVLRGGDWSSPAASLETKVRASWDRGWRFSSVGFRCAREL